MNSAGSGNRACFMAAGRMMTMLLEDLRESVRKTATNMEKLGLTRGTSGNVSTRDPRSGLVAITPSGLPYSALTSADVTVVDLDGRVIDGSRKPSSETPMHCAVYRASQAAEGGAIVHTHSPFATAFAVMNRDLPPITVPLALLGNVPVVPFMMPGSAELAAAVASAIAAGQPTKTLNTTCCLLQNHGLVCTGPSLEKALESAVYVEEGAQVAIYVLSAGGEISPIPSGIAAKMRSEYRR